MVNNPPQSSPKLSPSATSPGRIILLRKIHRLVKSKTSYLNKIISIIGWDLADWQWLLCFHLLADKVYIYDSSSLSARKAKPGEIPWQILWFLSRFHKKHRFSHNSPKLDTLLPYLASFESKLRWSYKFRENLSDDIPLRVPTRFCMKAPPSDSPDLEHFIRQFRSHSLSAYNKSIGVAKDKKPGNITSLAKLGRKLLNASNLAAAPTDKDGGYAIMPGEVLENAHKAILMSKSYRYSPVNDWNSLTIWYFKLSKRIAKYANQPRLGAAINKSIMLADSSYISTLQVTCKTHKPAGKVTFRNIHSSSGWRFLGLSLWASGELRSILKSRSTSHILKDSQDFVERLRNVEFRSDQFMVKVDVKDFFMSGTPSELTTPIVDSLPTATLKQRTYKLLLLNVLDFLLENQYICSHYCPEEVFNVVEGTGMGLLHSGDLADAALFFLAEFQWACNPKVQSDHGIAALFRFKDDIICFVNSPLQWEIFFKEYCHRSSCFKLELEEISDTSVKYLDLEVTKEKGWYKATPYIKPSNLGIPLGIQSSHPLSVHLSWPKGVLNRLSTLTHSQQDLTAVHKLFVERLHQSFHHPLLVSQVANLQLVPKKASRTIKDGEKGQNLWCVLPFHPALKSVMTKELHKFLGTHEARRVMSQLFGKVKELKICWANTLPSHMSLVQTCQRRMDGDGGG